MKKKSSKKSNKTRATTRNSISASVSPGRYFGEPTPKPGELQFVDQKSDSKYYRLVDPSLLQKIPAPSISPPRLSLQDIVGSDATAKIQSSGQIVFHSVGDTGVTMGAGPGNEAAVTDKMAGDFEGEAPQDVPAFLYHLGDVIYNFGEDEYYYDQFYEPFRNYQAPIVGIPGNHDGVIYSGDPESSLAAFLQHFCSPTPVHAPQAGGLVRTTMTQPGVYFTFDAPFVTLIGLYSNVLEDPGVISSEGGKNPSVDDQQLDFLESELKRLGDSAYSGAVIVSVHHPPYTVGAGHGSSPRMLQDIETAISNAGNFWPHAIISGHAHNYERYTRTVGSTQVPFIIAGSGGHAATKIRSGPGNTVIRTPMQVINGVTLERYFGDYGYLRVIVTKDILTFEFHDVSAGLASKSPSDICSLDLKTRTLVSVHA
jgi:hypothetical protein